MIVLHFEKICFLRLLYLFLRYHEIITNGCSINSGLGYLFSQFVLNFIYFSVAMDQTNQVSICFFEVAILIAVF